MGVELLEMLGFENLELLICLEEAQSSAMEMVLPDFEGLMPVAARGMAVIAGVSALLGLGIGLFVYAFTRNRRRFEVQRRGVYRKP